MQITDAAVFYSRLSKWQDHFGEFETHTIERQLYYSLSFESQWDGSGSFQFVSDISETLLEKLAAIRCYATQFPPAKEYLFDRVQSLARVNGAIAGFEAGEVLTSTRAIGSHDVMQTLLLNPPTP